MIYEDIDRKDGSTWSQILAICLETITGIDSRISEYERSTIDGKAEALKMENPIPQLPRIGQPLKDGIARSGDLFEATPRPKSRGASAAQYFETISKSLGQSTPRNTSPVIATLMAKAEDAVHTRKQKEDLAKDGFPAPLRDWAIWFLQTHLGWPFRQEFSRKIANVVLGSPYGDVGMIVDAIDSLTRLAVCSLQEDKYGGVQKDVKKIVQILTATYTKLEKFKTTMKSHWTDVEKKRESNEVAAILDALTNGLDQLVEAFGNYSEDLRLSQSEMRLAREAATPARTKREQQTQK